MGIDPLTDSTGSSESFYLDQPVVVDRGVGGEAADRNLLTGLG